MYGSIFLLTLKFENVINLLLLCLSNLEYKTILLCCHKQSPSKCYSGRFFYYNTFLDSIFFWILSRTTFVGHTVISWLYTHYKSISNYITDYARTLKYVQLLSWLYSHCESISNYSYDCIYTIKVFSTTLL